MEEPNPLTRGQKTVLGLIVAVFVAFFIWLLQDDAKKRAEEEAERLAEEAERQARNREMHERLNRVLPNCFVVHHAEPLIEGLSPDGHVDAIRIGQQLAELITPAVEVIVLTSPASRCVETARGLMAAYNATGDNLIKELVEVGWLGEDAKQFSSEIRKWFRNERHGRAVVLVTHSWLYPQLTNQSAPWYGEVAGLLESIVG